MKSRLTDPEMERPASQPIQTDFHMNVGLRVTIDGAPFFVRGWLETIPRRLV